MYMRSAHTLLLTASANVTCSPSLDHGAGRSQRVFDQGGPMAADRFMSAAGGLLPIAL